MVALTAAVVMVSLSLGALAVMSLETVETLQVLRLALVGMLRSLIKLCRQLLQTFLNKA